MKILKIAWATFIAVLLGFIFFVITDLVIISLGFAYNKTGNAVLDWLTLPQEMDRIYLVIYPLSILVYSIIFFKWINKDKEEAQVHWDIKSGVQHNGRYSLWRHIYIMGNVFKKHGTVKYRFYKEQSGVFECIISK